MGFLDKKAHAQALRASTPQSTMQRTPAQDFARDFGQSEADHNTPKTLHSEA